MSKVKLLNISNYSIKNVFKLQYIIAIPKYIQFQYSNLQQFETILKQFETVLFLQDMIQDIYKLHWNIIMHLLTPIRTLYITPNLKQYETILFLQDMIQDIYKLRWNIIHKSTGVTWNVGLYKLIRLPWHPNLNINLT